MKDFDEERAARYEGDREFQIGGEKFVRRASVRPEVLMAVDDLDAGAPGHEMLKSIDGVILAFIESTDDAHDRYRTLRERDDDPVNMADLNAVVRWLVSEMTGRPMPAPSLSEDGRAPNGTGSTDGSSLRAVTA